MHDRPERSRRGAASAARRERRPFDGESADAERVARDHAELGDVPRAGAARYRAARDRARQERARRAKRERTPRERQERTARLRPTPEPEHAARSGPADGTRLREPNPGIRSASDRRAPARAPRRRGGTPPTPPPAPPDTSRTPLSDGPPAAAAARLSRAQVAIACLAALALLITGSTWYLMGRVVGGFSLSSALAAAGGARSTDGGQNILLIGLDTRKDRNGDQLPEDVLSQLHAGDGDEGGYNTNTLIVVHIPADKKSVSAVSVPRDDLVPVEGINGVHRAKIKQAYGMMKAQREDELHGDGVTDPVELETKGREAGRTATIKTVEQFLDIPIDRFAEVSLIGFYDIAQALGGVTVCLNHPVHDSFSGARFPAGVQHLDAAQSLAFVRQRHGLDNGDLDRTHRQQAFVASVLHALQSNGTLSNVGTMDKLVSATHDDVVLSSGWDIPRFAQDMNGLSLKKLRFSTLPIKSYSTVDGQDVNLVDTAQVRSTVRTAFGYQPPSAPTSHTQAPAGTADVHGEAKAVAKPQSDGSVSVPSTGSNVRGGGVPCVN
ncbi:LCP family protein [Tsukamurella sp. 8J]|uniref:LCP family protein n=1 Tax=Tsukamurella sp. 8J TaxID=3031962 RepID=UPI0023B8FEB1|nr:LCP family protein [Tsukamurella sp. 8J]MDF0531356.1 LCP family protein [Tsukamurella sp. 8J]